jgi:fibronectin type 3 domain-containing protein
MPLRRYITLYLTSLVALAGSLFGQTTFIPAGATWKYLDTGVDQGTAWRAVGFNDGAWASGPAQLGYGDGGEATVVGYGPSSTAKYVTTYFRKSFTITNPASVLALALELVRDDGAVVYLNGTEVVRSNLPTGTIAYSTLGTVAIGGADESTFYPFSLSPSLLVAGTNVIAVEMHQQALNSSDISFDLKLTDGQGPPTVVRGPYLQRISTSQATLRWRTSVATDSRVAYGTSAAGLNLSVTSATAKTDHNLILTGLQPGTLYYYSVGNAAGAVVSGPEYYFRTNPPIGPAKATRLWVLGDSGTGTTGASAVRDAFYAANGGPHTDVTLLLGDNAYNAGTDAEYQTALFNMYPTMMRNTPMWATIGNHEATNADSATMTGPYYDIFSLPRNGEAGGIASGTEAYYSFDYANMHFVCLDSEESSRVSTGAMYTWLQNDLAATTQEWIIAFWHSPPYTKGSHDSDVVADSGGRMKDMREVFLPLLENYGVDLVLNGHSHVYERSYLIDGHYNVSTTFSAATMIKDGTSGNPATTGAYVKQPVGHDGAVYVVTGSAAQTGTYPLNHPAMCVSLSQLGSLVLDVNGNQLDASFLTSTGAVMDRFALRHEAPPGQFDVVVDNADPAGFTATGAWATATTPAGFYGTNFLSDQNQNKGALSAQFTPYIPAAGTYAVSLRWPSAVTNATNVAVDVRHAGGVDHLVINQRADGGHWVLLGNYSFNARDSATAGSVLMYTADPVSGLATDGIVIADAVRFSGGPADTTAPAVPTGLIATVQGGAIGLDWADAPEADFAGYTLSRALAVAGPYAPLATHLHGSAFTDTGLTSGVTYFYTVAAVDVVGNVSAPSAAVSGTPMDTLAPAAPLGLLSTAGDSQVGLDWSDSPEPDWASYRVYRSTVTGTGFALVATVTASAYQDTTATNGTTFYYIVTAVDGANNESLASAEVSGLPLDTTPPPVPTGLAATAGDGAVSLDWADSPAADFATFRVYRSTTLGSGYALIGSPTASAYADVALTNGTSYFYFITAVDLMGNASTGSLVATAIPVDLTPPAAPSGLVATAGATSISLDWADNMEPDLASYHVFRSTTAGSGYVQLTTSTVSAATDSAVTVGTTYYYIVRALDAVGNVSAASAVGSALFVDIVAPAAPIGLTAVAGNATVTLDWTDNTEPDRAGYRIYRSTTAGSGYTQIATTTTVSAYTNTGLTNGTTYYYTVSAIDTAGNLSATSGSASAMPDVPRLWVGNIAMAAAKNTSGVQGTATVTIRRTGNILSPGAVVTGQWKMGTTVINTVTATATAQGVATLTSTRKKMNTGTVLTFTVTNVTTTGFTYTPTLNVETSDTVLAP